MACDEVVVVDKVEYAVPQQWCPRKIDSSLLAEPGDLVQLPQELTFEDYRIYVTSDTRDAFVAMATAARKDSIDLIADSGFRSLSFQRRIIRKRLAAGETIERVFLNVAPPGYSEHHTGRALDLVPSEARFAHTPTYKWLSENAGEFGFVETYQDIEGDNLRWESWHWYHTPATK
jgi:D-alanyl-D-alanine carboxypeptidase